ncbi:MAG TPA: group I intron-associated PD-(D/E)XK endonuclease [Gemmatimonadaceae bacterium]|nr:group I intron-associated PD-(D/E)XK endonuclease [Gemmatimonadaceae bacterium]
MNPTASRLPILKIDGSALHTRTVGDIPETYVAARLLERGLTVCKPIGDDCRFDLVVYDGERFYRVQCKMAIRDKKHRGVLRFATKSNAGHYAGQIDYFGVYWPEERRVYLVPVDECGRSEGYLRLAPAANGQTAGVRLAEAFAV